MHWFYFYVIVRVFLLLAWNLFLFIISLPLLTFFLKWLLIVDFSAVNKGWFSCFAWNMCFFGAFFVMLCASTAIFNCSSFIVFAFLGLWRWSQRNHASKTTHNLADCLCKLPNLPKAGTHLIRTATQSKTNNSAELGALSRDDCFSSTEHELCVS